MMVRRTWMSSPWALQQRLLPMEHRRIHGIQSMYQADLPVVRSSRSSGGMFLRTWLRYGWIYPSASIFCGVVGMKPTYGTVSRYGLIAYGSSLDQIGPLTKDVTDCATILEAIASYDEKTPLPEAGRYRFFYKSTKGRCERHEDRYSERLFRRRSGSGSKKEKVLAAANLLKEKGAVIEEFDLALVKYAIPNLLYDRRCGGKLNLERFDGVKYGYRAESAEELHAMYKQTRSEGFGPEVKRRIMLGSFVLSSGYYDAYYLKALKVKALIKKAFDEAFCKI